jgi:hypothetical protein
MESTRFDELTRLVARRSTRRQIVRAGLGMFAGWIAVSSPNRASGQEGCGTEAPCSEGQICQESGACCAVEASACDEMTPCCDPNVTCCNGTCVPLSTTANCGACGNACEAGTLACCNGTCCEPGIADCCNGSCRVPLDPNNCGGCGVTCPPCTICSGTPGAEGCTAACGPNQICDEGSCVDCPAGLTSCFYFCADLLSDDNNCRECERACGDFGINGSPVGSFCVDGACVCPEGTQSCVGDTEDYCTDTSTNPEHCGGCDTRCRNELSGAICVAGLCQCPPDSRLCGRVCCPSGAACEDGVCTCQASDCACPEETALCGGECADLRYDPRHCGACDVACGPNETCFLGICECAYFCPPDGCVDVQTDARHCGTCDRACAMGEACTDGICVRPGDQPEEPSAPGGNGEPPGEPTPIPGPGNAPTATAPGSEGSSVTTLPSTGSGVNRDARRDGRRWLPWAGATVSAAVTAWLRHRVGKDSANPSDPLSTEMGTTQRRDQP